MALNFFEKHDSRPTDRTALTGSVVRKWIAAYSTDETAVNTGLLAVATLYFDNLIRTNYNCTPLGGGIWECEAEYTFSPTAATDSPDAPTAPGATDPLGPENSFDVSAGTVHITQSLGTKYTWQGIDGPAGINLVVTGLVGSTGAVLTPDGYTPVAGDVGKYVYIARDGPNASAWTPGAYLITAQGSGTWTVTGQPAAATTSGGVWVMSSNTYFGSATGYQQAIGVTRDGIAGTEIYAPKFEFAIVAQQYPVTLATLKAFRNLVGNTNVATWRGFQPGEVLYLGCTGQCGPNGNTGGTWTLSHKFAIGENLYAVKITNTTPPLTVPYKGAWDYLWCFYSFDKSNTVVGQLPVAAYVEQVYRAGDFSALGVG